MKKIIYILAFLVGASAFFAHQQAHAQPEIFFNTNELYFGDIPFGNTYTALVLVSNTGNQPLQITNVTVSSQDFTVAPTFFTVNYDSLPAFIYLSFTPSVAGIYNETLTIFSNDPINPVLEAAIYANVSVPEPLYLAGRALGNAAELSWGGDDANNKWISYATASIGSAAGLSEPGVFRIASRWPASEMSAFIGKQLSRMSFFASSETTIYTIKIWKGNNAESLVFEQTVPAGATLNYREIIFNESVIVEPGQDYWFGLELDQSIAYDFGAAFDNGPAVTGFGDMIDLGNGWQSVSQFGLDFNWLIHVFIQDDNNSSLSTSPETIEFPLQKKVQLQINDEKNTEKPIQTNTINSFIGYNVYRNNILITPEPVNTSLFMDENLSPGAYNYAVKAVYDVGESTAQLRTVQIGGPSLMVSPFYIRKSIQIGETSTASIQLNNTGITALQWSASNLPAWLSISPEDGIINPGDSLSVTLQISTNGLFNGIHYQPLVIQTNDLTNPQSIVGVLLTIDGSVNISFDEALLNFGMTPVFQSKMLLAHVTNYSNVPTYLFNSATGTNAFIAYPQNWIVQPGGTETVQIWFTPDQAGFINDTLYLNYFNAFENDTLKLPLIGEGAISQPAGLSYTINEDQLNLQWFAPQSSPNELRYGSGEAFNSVFTNDSIEYEMMAKFGPNELMSYAGKQLESIGFYLYSNNIQASIKIYSGELATNLLLEIPVTNPQQNDWTDINLPEPILLDAYNWLWIGYSFSSPDFIAAAGIDNGPGIHGKGDLFKVNGGEWRTLSQYNINGNWNIRGLLADAGSGDSTINNTQKNSGFELLGYKVYQSGNLLTNNPITATSYSTTAPLQPEVFGVSAVFSYGESNPSEILVEPPITMNLPSGWEFAPSPMSHNIHIPTFVEQIGMALSPGDMIGAFYHDNGQARCAGAGIWTGNHLVITVYGDNPATSFKDGFIPGEAIHWKIYMHQQQQTAAVTASYSHDMPEYQGSFSMLGLSMINAVELSPVGMEEIIQQRMLVYPNPALASFSIRGLESGDQLRIYSTTGSVVAERITLSKQENFNGLRPGIYIIERINGFNQAERQKLIIQ